MEASIFLSRLKLRILKRQSPEKKRLALKERTMFAKQANYTEVNHANAK